MTINTIADVVAQKHVQESGGCLYMKEMQSFHQELRAFREQFDTDMAQIHAELAKIYEMLLWMAQRLPQEPISPPPAQFLKHNDGENI